MGQRKGGRECRRQCVPHVCSTEEKEEEASAARIASASCPFLKAGSGFVWKACLKPQDSRGQVHRHVGRSV